MNELPRICEKEIKEKEICAAAAKIISLVEHPNSDARFPTGYFGFQTSPDDGRRSREVNRGVPIQSATHSHCRRKIHTYRRTCARPPVCWTCCDRHDHRPQPL